MIEEASRIDRIEKIQEDIEMKVERKDTEKGYR